MLEAVFTANVDEIKVSGLTQWDRGQMLQITCPDLPAAFQVHFTNRARAKAIPVHAVGADNVTTVAIPDEILREPFEVLVHLYFTEGDAGLIGETVRTIRMPITPRAQPEDYVADLTQEQQTEAEILVEKLLDDYATQAANAAAKGALAGIQNALDNLPEGDTLIINDLTTGGASAALSAEMGKTLGRCPKQQILINADFTNVINQRGKTEYTAKGYSVDGWFASYNNTKVTVGDGGITFANEGTQSLFIQQRIENPERLYGKTVTLSAIIEGHGLLQSTGNVPSALPSATTRVCTLVFAESPNSGTARTALFMGTDGKLVMQFAINVGSSYKVKAVKLELGDTQTLAHQDAAGNWVLNEVPDYGTELLRCQRYYQLFTSAEKRPTDKRDFKPELRTDATSANTGTIDIDGVTYYYADASL